MLRPSLTWLIPSAALAALGLLSWELDAARRALDDGRREAQVLSARLEQERVDRSRLEAASRDLRDKAERLEQAIADAGRRFAASDADLTTHRTHVEARARAVMETLEAMEERMLTLEDRADVALARSEDAARRLDEIAPGDYGAMLAATVKISSRSDVGSGSVIYCAPHGGGYLAYVVTAHHIVELNDRAGTPIPLDVISFADGARTREEKGVVVASEPERDLALIEVRCPTPYTAIARFASLESVLGTPLHTRVHAIGCPLGYPPIPTSGELVSKSKALEGLTYWMTNAPTIFGNSGGGIYHAGTGELLGVLSRIAAYKSLMDVPVPHMGILTPMSDVATWLSASGYGFVVRQAPPPEAAALAAAAPSSTAAALPLRDEEPPPAPPSALPARTAPER